MSPQASSCVAAVAVRQHCAASVIMHSSFTTTLVSWCMSLTAKAATAFLAEETDLLRQILTELKVIKSKVSFIELRETSAIGLFSALSVKMIVRKR